MVLKEKINNIVETYKHFIYFEKNFYQKYMSTEEYDNHSDEIAEFHFDQMKDETIQYLMDNGYIKELLTPIPSNGNSKAVYHYTYEEKGRKYSRNLQRLRLI
ncbi:hypothetical protein ACFL1H_03665 [Nanoarchaeota archaeon]